MCNSLVGSKDLFTVPAIFSFLIFDFHFCWIILLLFSLHSFPIFYFFYVSLFFILFCFLFVPYFQNAWFVLKLEWNIITKIKNLFSKSMKFLLIMILVKQNWYHINMYERIWHYVTFFETDELFKIVYLCFERDEHFSKLWTFLQNN